VSSPSRAKVNKNIILPVELVVGESFLSSMSYVVDDNDSIPVQTSDSPCSECEIAGVPDIPDSKLREENFMVMEYLPHNLKGLTMAGVSMTQSFQLRVSSSILKAVRTLHRHNIVHHHINCNQILLSDTGR
jgi:serine/threonine protein kinase